MFVAVDDEGEISPIPLISIDLTTAVAADYLSFVQGIADYLLRQKSHLEREANQSGRTIDHEMFGAGGSLPLEVDY